MGWLIKLSGVAMLLAGLATSAANANTYDFSLSGSGISGNGVLTTANGSSTSPFAILGISGTISGLSDRLRHYLEYYRFVELCVRGQSALLSDTALYRFQRDFLCHTRRW